MAPYCKGKPQDPGRPATIGAWWRRCVGSRARAVNGATFRSRSAAGTRFSIVSAHGRKAVFLRRCSMRSRTIPTWNTRWSTARKGGLTVRPSAPRAADGPPRLSRRPTPWAIRSASIACPASVTILSATLRCSRVLPSAVSSPTKRSIRTGSSTIWSPGTPTSRSPSVSSVSGRWIPRRPTRARPIGADGGDKDERPGPRAARRGVELDELAPAS